MASRFISFGIALAAFGSANAQGLAGDELQRALKDNAASFWVYDDLAAAEKSAKKSGRPLLISFRCVP